MRHRLCVSAFRLGVRRFGARRDGAQPEGATRSRWLVLAGVAGVVLLGATAIESTPASAEPIGLSASPNPVLLCATGTMGTTTVSWDVRGDANGAYLWEDPGTGYHQVGPKLYGTGSEPQTVFYNNGNPNLFALSLDSPAIRYSPVIDVGVQQQPQQACPSPPPPPPPSSLTLPATRFVSSVKTYSHNSGDVWCGGVPPFGGGALYDHGTAPDYDVTALGNRLAVGYIHFFDSGSDPLPCSSQGDEFYRGGVGFDSAAINTFIKGHGLSSATLTFRQDNGTQSCIDHIGVNSDPAWDTLVPGATDVLPEGPPDIVPKMTPASGGGFLGQADVSAALRFSLLFNGGTVNPHLHFVFVGADEDIYAQDNVACDSTVSSLALQLNGEQTQRLGGPLPPAPPPAPTGCSFYGANTVMCDAQQPAGVTQLALGFGVPGSLTFPLAASEVSTLSNGTWSNQNFDGKPLLSFDAAAGTYTVAVCSLNASGHTCTPPTTVTLSAPPSGGGASGGGGSIGPGCPSTGCAPRGHAHE
jgi:hypothetical protein